MASRPDSAVLLIEFHLDITPVTPPTIGKIEETRLITEYLLFPFFFSNPAIKESKLILIVP
jgi:hypothetical protein